MRTLLLTCCVAALLAGCSDDKTDDPQPQAVVGNAQFAAAVDELPAETRASLADGVTMWEAGDEVGITAMIDGTPYVKNVPYRFTETTSFGYLSPVAAPILWNESVVGERSFFALWPYKPADDGYTEMDGARFGFSLPEEQQIVAGRNLTKPLLVGHAKTAALTGRPIALRFSNLFPVLELRFEPFAETSLAQIVIEPAEEAQFDGYLTAEGTVTDRGRLILDRSGRKLTVTCADVGLDIARGASLQIPVGRFTVTGGLKFTVTTTDDRTFSYVAFADEPCCSYVADEAGQFVRARYIRLAVPLEVVSDETREVYFEDDLNWIGRSERWKNGSTTGGGWPTMTAAGSPTGKPNYFTVDLIPDFTTLGYVKSEQRTSVQARQEGFLCLGTTSAQGALITPVLSGIGDEPTDILVSFYGATYASENLQADGKPLTVKVLNAGTIGEEGAAETEVEILNYYGWRKYWIIVEGATSATQIQFGKDVKEASGRVLLDNILIGKAVKGAVAGSREVNVAVEPYLKTLEVAGKYNYEIENAAGATGACVIQSNLPWTASCEADWVSVTPTVEYNGSGLPYGITVTARTLNETGRERTAEVVFAAGDLTQTVVFTQSGELPAKVIIEDDFQWSAGDGDRGGIPEPGDTKIPASVKLGSNGTKYDKWDDKDYMKYGWTSPVNNNAYVRDGMLVCGIAGTPGGIVSPAFEAIGEGVMDVVVEFDILEYKNAAEKGKTWLAVYAGGGEIESISGHYTKVENDTYTRLSEDKRTQWFYCGDYGAYTNGGYWHHVVVELKGATRETKIQVQGLEGNCRFYFDNFTVIEKK